MLYLNSLRRHDGVIEASGTSNEYYIGANDWAPIMGEPAARPRTLVFLRMRPPQRFERGHDQTFFPCWLASERVYVQHVCTHMPAPASTHPLGTAWRCGAGRPYMYTCCRPIDISKE